jgi:probable F420-dependent oxidoreductase
MLIGVVFPQTEIGADPAIVRDYVQTAEALGYNHLLVYDHVLGASTTNRPDWRGPYTSDTQFHEPFVLFGYIAGLTTQIEIVTGVIVLPQRQTALVAKQAAEVDILSGGRLRLGVGIGWNEVEYEALNESFGNRGKRIEEQIEVMRRLWTEPVVDFKGKWHTIPEAGIKPLPVQRPIPVWIGGGAEAVLERVGRIGDGWFPQMRPDDRAREAIEKIKVYAAEAGRNSSSIGIEARLNLREGDPESWSRQIESWKELGATHIGINTMGMGLGSPQAHIDMIAHFNKSLAMS